MDAGVHRCQCTTAWLEPAGYPIGRLAKAAGRFGHVRPYCRLRRVVRKASGRLDRSGSGRDLVAPHGLGLLSDPAAGPPRPSWSNATGKACSSAPRGARAHGSRQCAADSLGVLKFAVSGERTPRIKVRDLTGPFPAFRMGSLPVQPPPRATTMPHPQCHISKTPFCHAAAPRGHRTGISLLVVLLSLLVVALTTIAVGSTVVAMRAADQRDREARLRTSRRRFRRVDRNGRHHRQTPAKSCCNRLLTITRNSFSARGRQEDAPRGGLGPISPGRVARQAW